MSASTPLYLSAPGQRKAVSVFCGSSPGKKAIYTSAAESLGKALAESNTPLVYGGGRRGLMGSVSRATLEAGGYVHGILPNALVKRAMENTSSATVPNGSVGTSSQPLQSGEGQGADVMEGNADERLSLELVATMHERLLRFAKLSEGGFINLPGGYGTFEEMFEMVTWTQLGIHRLPVIALNVDSYYSPLREMLDKGVEAGFIYPENRSLLQVVDLDPSDPSANSDESRVGEWGLAAVEALEKFKFAEGSGYGFTWKEEKSGGVVSDSAKVPLVAGPSFSLFSTARFTSCPQDGTNLLVEPESVPLLDYHLDRLRKAHAYFAQRDGTSVWGQWGGNDALWAELRHTLEVQQQAGSGDWRVRILVHPGGGSEIQLIPAPRDIAPFALYPTDTRPLKRKRLVLDPVPYDPAAETESERAFRLYKTTRREAYDEAGRRGDALTGAEHTEVVLHTATHLLETNISNIALQIPSGSGELEWVTPRLDGDRLPFLDGVVRRFLLEQGRIREGQITLEDWTRCARDGLRVIVFNGLRGVVEAEAVE